MRSERLFDGMKVPLCNDCVFFLKGMSRCGNPNLFDSTHTGYWPSDALGNRLAEYRCGMSAKYFQHIQKNTLLSRFRTKSMEVKLDFIVVAAIVTVLFVIWAAAL